MNATVTIDRKAGTATVDLELVGHNELEHELLAAFFTSRSVSLSPTHNGDVLGSRFVIYDRNAFETALHNLDNRKRKADGRPTIEEEADAARKAKEATANAEASQKERDAKAERDKKDSQARVEAAAAKEIADRTMQSKEPKSVQ